MNVVNMVIGARQAALVPRNFHHITTISRAYRPGSQKDKLSIEQQLHGLEGLVGVRGQRRLVRLAGDHKGTTTIQ